MSRSLIWFRRDLRTQDNTALHEAARASNGGVVAVFILCPKQWEQHGDARVKVDFWLRNLKVLSESLARLRIPLLLERAESIDQVPD